MPNSVEKGPRIIPGGVREQLKALRKRPEQKGAEVEKGMEAPPVKEEVARLKELRKSIAAKPVKEEAKPVEEAEGHPALKEYYRGVAERGPKAERGPQIEPEKEYKLAEAADILGITNKRLLDMTVKRIDEGKETEILYSGGGREELKFSGRELIRYLELTSMAPEKGKAARFKEVSDQAIMDYVIGRLKQEPDLSSEELAQKAGDFYSQVMKLLEKGGGIKEGGRIEIEDARRAVKEVAKTMMGKAPEEEFWKDLTL